MKYAVTGIKSLQAVLKDLGPFIRDGHLIQRGQTFGRIGLNLRELLGNWLLCVAVNSVTKPPNRLSFTSDPLGGDGIIRDTVTDETWPTEHVLVPRLSSNAGKSVEALILEAVDHKQKKGPTYAKGKTLVVFLNDGNGRVWLPDNVADRLPSPLHFEAAWVVGLQSAEAGEYVYNVTRLDLSRGHAPVWRVLIGKDFNQWAVEPVLSPRSEQKDHHPSAC
jgi:hypothetical protein